MGLPALAVAMAQDLSLRIRTVTLLLAASNLLSRLLGYARDWLISYHFGASDLTDVYQASFLLPDMLNYLLAGGALTVSLLPRMSGLYAAERLGEVERGPDGLTPAHRAFSIVFTFMLVLASALVLLAEAFATPIVATVFHGFRPDQIEQTAHLTRIVLPAQLFFICGGLVQATLLARQDFKAMALTPLLYNLGILGGGAVGGATGHIEGFSWGALVGAAIGGLAVPVWSAAGKLRFRLLFRPFDPEIRRFLWTALPLMVGVSLTTVDEWLGRYFGSQLEAGSISWLAMARRVMLVPIGLLGTAAGQATGAFIARLYAEARKDELAEVLARSVAAVVGLSLVLSAFLAAMAAPIVAFLFQYGRFEAADTARTAAALAPLTLGIAAWGAQSVLARAFYGTGDTWRPMIVSTVITLAMLPVYAGLTRFGIRGLAIAGTLGMTLQALALLVLARRRLALAVRPLLLGTMRALVVAVVAGSAAWGTDWWVRDAAWLPGQHTLHHLVRLTLAGCAWGVVLVGLGTALSMPGMPRVLDRVLARLRPRPDAA